SAAWAGGTPLAAGVALVALLAALDPIQIDLLNGQVNTELLVLVIVFVDQYARGRRKTAAAALGAAIALKIVPLVFALFLLVRRDFRVLGGALLVAAACCVAPV